MATSTCPICGRNFPPDRIAAHVDRCLMEQQRDNFSPSSLPHVDGTGGKSKWDRLRESQMSGKLGIGGFLELLEHASKGSSIHVDGILQMCVLKVKAQAPKISSARHIRAFFEEESFTYSLANDFHQTNRNATRSVKDPNTISVLVPQYYAKSLVSFRMESLEISKHCPCFPCISSSGASASECSDQMLRVHTNLETVFDVANALSSPEGQALWLSTEATSKDDSISVFVWFRYIQTLHCDDGLQANLCNAIFEGDSTTVGLICNLSRVKNFLHSSEAYDLLKKVLTGFDENTAVDLENNKNKYRPNYRAALRFLLKEVKSAPFFSKASIGVNASGKWHDPKKCKSILHFAVEYGADSTTLVEEAHDLAPDMLKVKVPPYGLTPFLMACVNGKLKMAQHLATQGIRISRRPVTADNGDTALILAARSGHTKMVKWLLSKEADPNQPNSGGETPLDTIVGHTCDKTAAAISKALIGAGAKIDLSPGNRILHVAARIGNFDTFRLLVESVVLQNDHISVVDALLISDSSWHITPFELARQGQSDGHHAIQKWIRTKLHNTLSAEMWEGSVTGKGRPVARKILLVGAFGTCKFDCSFFEEENNNSKLSTKVSQVKLIEQNVESLSGTDLIEADFDEVDLAYESDDRFETESGITSAVQKRSSSSHFFSFSSTECASYLERLPEKFMSVVGLSKKYRTFSNSHLAKNKWDLIEAINQWFEQGLQDEGAIAPLVVEHCRPSLQDPCLICGEADSDLVSLNNCGHKFCKSCWASYIKYSMKSSGSEAISCPHHNCSTIIDSGILEYIAETVDSDIRSNLLEYKIRRFVQVRRDTACFCPFPGCEEIIVWKNARDVSASMGQGCVVKCKHRHPPFCFHCGYEAHAPASCLSWSKFCSYRDKDDALLSKWLYNNTKLCSNCGTRIEKNKGCKHITCKCGHEFCWDCNQPWSLHDETTGGFFRCNLFDPQDGNRLAVNADSKHISKLEKFTAYLKRFNDDESEEHRAKILLDAFDAALERYYHEQHKANILKNEETSNLTFPGSNVDVQMLDLPIVVSTKADIQIEYRMGKLVRYFASDKNVSRKAQGNESKREETLLAEEKEQTFATFVRPLAPNPLHIYRTALEEIHTIFQSAKYVNAALFGAEGDQEAQLGLIDYRLDHVIMNALKLMQLLKPTHIGKIVENLGVIERLTLQIADARRKYMIDMYV